MKKFNILLAVLLITIALLRIVIIYCYLIKYWGKHSLPLHKTNSKLKLVSAIFYQIFIFSPNDSPLKTMKSVLYFI